MFLHLLFSSVVLTSGYLVRKGLFSNGWKRRLMRELSQQFAQSTREAEPVGAAPSAELDCPHLHAQEQIDPMARHSLGWKA